MAWKTGHRRIGAALALACGATSHCQGGPRVDHQTDAGRIVPADSALYEVFPATATVERLATGFGRAEGPAWVSDQEEYLLFSDIQGRRVYRWDAGGRIKSSPAPFFLFPPPRGFGPNGLVVDSRGGLIICDQRGRRILQVDRDGEWTVLADRFRGKRLNSPNDLVLGSEGTLYFTDPPYGLRGRDKSSKKELDFNGVFRLRSDGRLNRLAFDLPRPNGIALSPDESILYVANSEASRPVIMKQFVAGADLETPIEFYDLGAAGGVDGLTVDHKGNVYAATPKGVWIIASDGRRLGSIEIPESPSDMTWGEAGTALYITAHTSLYRVLTSGQSTLQSGPQ